MRPLLFAGLLALLLIPAASSHTEQGYPPPTTCTHTVAEFWVPMPNGPSVKHRESYQSGYTSGGVHRHDYKVMRLAYNPPRWVFVHYHNGRVCPGHPV